MKTQATNSSYTAEDKASVTLREKLPLDWEVLRLGDIVDIQGGSQPPKSTFIYEPKEGYVRLLQIRDFGAKPVPTYVPKDKVTKFCEKDDIFIARYGASLGRIVTGMEGAYNVALAKVILNKNAIFPKYMFYLLKTPVFQTPIHMISRSAQNGFNKGEVFPIQLPIAPYEQQKRIVAEIEKQFSRLDEAVANLKRVKANLKRYKAAVLKAAVEGRLVETEAKRAHRKGRDYETGAQFLQRILEARRRQWQGKGKYKEPAVPDTAGLPELPVGWVWGTVGSLLLDIEAGKSFKCEERPPTEDEVGVVKVSAVTWGEFNENESKTCHEKKLINEKFMIRPGDFLFSRANTIELVGACVIARKVTINVMLSDKILRFRLLGGLDKWVLYNLRSKFGRGEIERLATGNQESMRNIGQERIRAIRIPMPPPAECGRIVVEIEHHLSLVSELEIQVETNLKRAERLRQSILSRGFSGKLCS